MATQPVKEIVRQVRPLLSTDSDEAKKRVLRLYKAWYRHIDPMIAKFNLTVTNAEAKAKLKKEFMKHRNLTDIRAIDLLVVKGEMELKEVLMNWKQQCHVMYYFKDTHNPQPKSFLGKFLSGVD